MEFALVAYRREDIKLQKRESIEHDERLIRIARKNHFIKHLLYVVLVLSHDVGCLAIHFSDWPAEVNLVSEIFVDGSRALVPCLHGRGGFNIKKFKIPGK